MRRSMAIAVVALLLGACRTERLPYYADRTLTPRWLADEPVSDTLHRIGDFRLVDENGKATTVRDVRGTVYVASFFYTSCEQLCPKLRSQLSRVIAAFPGDDVRILSHTIAPESDSVAVLRRYARENALDGRRWHLLTGARSEIERLARDEYFVELGDSGGKTTGKLLHTETFVLVDTAGYIRGVYDGSLSYDVSRLIDDIRTLRGS